MPGSNVGPRVAPAVLAQIPKMVVRALDVHEVLLAALNATKHTTLYGPAIALRSVESYFDAAKRQQRRIRRAKGAIGTHRSGRLGGLFADVHYYLICWARIAKLARFFARATKFRRTGLVLRQYHRELDERIDGRNHLEHFEERVPGGREHDRLNVPNDLLNMMNQCLTYGGRTVDVGPASIGLLSTFVTELRKALLFDSVEALANADMTELTRVVQAAARDVHVALVMKRIRKPER